MSEPSPGEALDPGSPVPLYHQIAEIIRERIESGELEEGHSLEPLRKAAAAWGVNLHTVRHAYAALARDGWIETRRGPHGTRVRPRRPHPGRVAPPTAAIDRFLDRIATEAARQFDLDPGRLARAILDRAETSTGPARPQVFVVECSRWQCECHAAELEERWDVEARPWVIGEHDGAPPGPTVATYFHYNDLRRLWPRALGTIIFFRIAPDPALVPRLPLGGGGQRSILALERDPPTAEVVAADLSALLPPEVRVEPVVTETPDAYVRTSDPATPVVIAPRVWSELSEKARSLPHAFEARYIFDAAQLEKIGTQLRWRPARSPATRK